MTFGCSRVLTVAGVLAAVSFAGAGTAWAGAWRRLPLVGVTGPYGIVGAVLGYGGYLLVRQFRGRG